MLKRRTLSFPQISIFTLRFETLFGIQAKLLKVNVKPLPRAVDEFSLIQHWVSHLIFPSLCFSATESFLLQVVPSVRKSPIRYLVHALERSQSNKATAALS